MNYQTAGIFFLSGRNAESRFAPRSFRMFQTNRLFTFTTTMRMVVRVHRRTADSRADAHSSFASGSADDDIHMIRITGLTDRAKTFFINQTDFTGRHFQLREVSFDAHHKNGISGAASNLSALARNHFHAANGDAGGNKLYRHGIAGFYFNFFLRADNDIANFQTDRSDDISFIAIGVI